jgi:hypothetical protein
MDGLTGPALVAATLLALAGAQKLLDPTMTVGALRALGLPSAAAVVRAGSAVELALGVAAVAVGGAPLWWLVALSYVAFALVVIAALRRGTMIGSCGCFGREDTPPHPVHVALNLVLAAVAVAAAVSLRGALADRLVARPGQGVVIVLLSVLSVFLLHAAYVDLPRTLATRRIAHGSSH